MNTKTCLASLILVNCCLIAFAAETNLTGGSSGLANSTSSAGVTPKAGYVPGEPGSLTARLLNSSGTTGLVGNALPWDSGRHFGLNGYDSSGLAINHLNFLDTPLFLIDDLRHGKTSEDRVKAAEKLGRFSSDPAVLDALSDAVSDSDAAVSQAAFHSLGGISPYRAIWARWRNYLVIGVLVIAVCVARKLK